MMYSVCSVAFSFCLISLLTLYLVGHVISEEKCFSV